MVSSKRPCHGLAYYWLVLSVVAASFAVRRAEGGNVEIVSTSIVETGKSRTAIAALSISEEDAIDLFRMPTLSLPSMGSGSDDETVYTKTESIIRTIEEQGGLEVVWKGSISEPGRIGFATLIQGSNGELAGIMNTETSAFSLSTMPDGILQLRETFWRDGAPDGGSIEFEGFEGDIGGRSSGVNEPVSAALFVDNPKRDILETSRGNGARLTREPGSRMLRDEDRKLQSMTNVDVLVLISNRAACESAGLSFGCDLMDNITAPIEGLLRVAEEQTNTAMQAVGISASITFVQYIYLGPNDFDGYPSIDTLEFIRISLVIGAWRNEAGADLVCMITGDGPEVDQNQQEVVGNAYLNRPESTSTWTAMNQYAMSHEIFHCLGTRHSRNDCDTKHPYGHGLQVPGVLRTIMAYQCSTSSCPQIPYLSAEGHSYQGTPIGDSLHNNARLVAENIADVAAFRESVNPPRVSPPVSPLQSPPSPFPTAYPTSAPAPVSATAKPSMDSTASGFCFSDRMTVMVQGKKGATRMDELQIGDAILTSKGYSKVYSFGHHEPSKWTEFLQIYTANS